MQHNNSDSNTDDVDEGEWRQADGLVYDFDYKCTDALLVLYYFVFVCFSLAYQYLSLNCVEG